MNKNWKLLTIAISSSIIGSGVVIGTTLGIVLTKKGYARPSKNQLAWHNLEQYAFMHFGVNTFSNREWGWGDENPNIFNPNKDGITYNPRQWVQTIKDAGLKMVVLTCKHHDGFCLWPSQYTDHSVKNSTDFQQTLGHQVDVVKDVSDACHEFGIKFGVYLSPWDRSRADYGQASYVTYYQNQLKELLSNYGEISEVWFDGANGGIGWYGGVDGEPSGNKDDGTPDPDFDTSPGASHPGCTPHKINQETYYQWNKLFKMVHKYQPRAVICQGSDLRWCGNESGWMGDTNWNSYFATYPKAHDFEPSDADRLNVGDANGKYWLPAEVDTKISKGWFWSSDGDQNVQTSNALFNTYLHSVGRGAGMILNCPPTQSGLLDNGVVSSLNGYKTLIDNAFATKLGQVKNSNELDLPTSQNIKYIVLQEDISQGQRISSFRIQQWKDDKWETIGMDDWHWMNNINASETTINQSIFTTIGYKRILKTHGDSVSASKIRVEILDSKGKAKISNIEVY